MPLTLVFWRQEQADLSEFENSLVNTESLASQINTMRSYLKTYLIHNQQI